MRQPPANKNRSGVNLEALNPRTRYLFEKTGHFGPYTNSEYLDAVGVIEPTKAPEPDPPPAVIVAMELEDLLTASYQAADRAFQEAAMTAHKAGSSMWGGSLDMVENGQLTRRDANKARAAEEAFRVAAEAREDAMHKLRRARAASREAQAVWRNRLRAEEYDRTAKK